MFRAVSMGGPDLLEIDRMAMAEDSKTRYRMADETQRLRLADFEKSDDVSLSGDIAAARVLLENALQAGNASQALAVMGVLAALTKSERLRRIEDSTMLSKSAMRMVAQEMGRITSEVLREAGIQNWIELVDTICSRASETITSAVNPHESTSKRLGRR
jgi:hypothetical protein